MALLHTCAEFRPVRRPRRVLVRFRAALIAIAPLTGCSLLGPPLPPPPVSAEIAEYEAAPGKALNALVECARSYATTNSAAQGIAAETIVDAALYSCRRELEAYREIAAYRSRGHARVLGLIDRSEARTEEAVEGATSDARHAAMDAVVRTRAAAR